ncbi:hydroxyisourate hydrolase [Kineococcus rhizosphaerae]|uniref:5-hydroxyisourate hydrolase n=1 Tax=Kineococcus rhizosphaerae TaxID=559628 RepID=A0A2T0R664_9ACTN|nr:hydroxyisourate hydrolase [Kineococcus rhizosphaerae]PRY16641.1 5-hydroxyisourate hydrolase [Kineococcus rhizosphaerae]
MTSLSTHVLDAVTGTPAAGVALCLSAADGSRLVEAVTDADGRARLAEDLPRGTYRLSFATGEWCATAGWKTFYPEVVVAFTADGEPHLHVPLLLSPFAYSTYRGS